ncbi:hypothetical protein RRG08_032764 [Elysia crispata]|uniref:Uncharacterized protein n=1 Tax=Elysia crispata TaxID=231223 RepID=A0AAE0YNI9_9GAST|nr:hypothetical protein RRG08_032764 [Elysia crispata]
MPRCAIDAPHSVQSPPGHEELRLSVSSKPLAVTEVLVSSGWPADCCRETSRQASLSYSLATCHTRCSNSFCATCGVRMTRTE